MRLTADDNGRVACKALFPPKKVFSAERQPDGSIRLVELVEKGLPHARLERRKGRTVVVSDRVVTAEDVARAMESFP